MEDEYPQSPFTEPNITLGTLLVLQGTGLSRSLDSEDPKKVEESPMTALAAKVPSLGQADL